MCMRLLPAIVKVKLTEFTGVLLNLCNSGTNVHSPHGLAVSHIWPGGENQAHMKAYEYVKGGIMFLQLKINKYMYIFIH